MFYLVGWEFLGAARVLLVLDCRFFLATLGSWLARDRLYCPVPQRGDRQGTGCALATTP